MSRRALEVYQYAAPLVLAPLTLWLWWRTLRHDVALTLLAWAVPIVHAYVVPAVGTNVLGVWEFATRWRIGRFRPHHGFVFGSATALLAWCCYAGPARDAYDVARQALVFASVFGFWNLLYDVAAIESGLLRVYNQPWADGRGAEAIAFDYAPWFFAGFGAVYGAGLGIAEVLAQQGQLTPVLGATAFVVTLALGMALPVWGYRQRSFAHHGHSGCRPVAKRAS